MLKLEPAALSDVGRKRSNNQDFLGDILFKSGRPYGEEKLNERGHLYAVADGMGGYAGGEVASELAITTLFEQYYNAPFTGDIGADLSAAIKAANFQVHEEAGTSGRNQMGTTLTLVLIKGNKAIFGNVGDSRTYLIRHGIPERVTHDHSLVQEQIDAGVMTPDQAEKSQIKNFITRAIGHRDEVDPDLFEREIQPGDVMLLCSDGLHNMVKEVEMGTIIATNPDLHKAVKQLVDLANERGGPDNISVLAVRVDEVGEPLPPILNGRETVYAQPTTSIYSQATAPMASRPESDESLKTTIPMSVAGAVDAPPVQPTAQMVVGQRPRIGGIGLLVGLVVLIAIIAAIVFFLANSGANSATPAATATAKPVTTVTATTQPATTTQPSVSPLPTVTPRATGAAGGSENSVASPPVVGTTASTSSVNGTARVADGVGSIINNVSGTPGPGSAVGSGSANNLIECQVASPADLKTVQVELNKFFEKNNSYDVRLLDKNGSSVTSTFQEQNQGTGLYLAEINNQLLNSEYTLTIKRTGQSVSSYTLTIGPNSAANQSCSLGSNANQLVIKL